jgi:CheY-like chemotaxis protein
MKVHGRVLVADDDPQMLESVSAALERLGAEVLSARNGVELIERMANDGPFVLIVSDIAMPWVSGLQAMHSARTAGLTAPVLVITALRDDRIFDQARALGRHAILLRKPFDLSQLEAAVSKLLSPAEPEAAPPSPGQR